MKDLCRSWFSRWSFINSFGYWVACDVTSFKVLMKHHGKQFNRIPVSLKSINKKPSTALQATLCGRKTKALKSQKHINPPQSWSWKLSNFYGPSPFCWCEDKEHWCVLRKIMNVKDACRAVACKWDIFRNQTISTARLIYFIKWPTCI